MRDAILLWYLERINGPGGSAFVRALCDLLPEEAGEVRGICENHLAGLRKAHQANWMEHLWLLLVSDPRGQRRVSKEIRAAFERMAPPLREACFDRMGGAAGLARDEITKRLTFMLEEVWPGLPISSETRFKTPRGWGNRVVASVTLGGRGFTIPVVSHGDKVRFKVRFLGAKKDRYVKDVSWDLGQLMVARESIEEALQSTRIAEAS